jgi:hypothetical protein
MNKPDPQYARNAAAQAASQASLLANSYWEYARAIQGTVSQEEVRRMIRHHENLAEAASLLHRGAILLSALK